jgi:hypothetical protein
MSFGRERRRWIRGEEAARKESGESTGRGDQGKCDLGACALCERVPAMPAPTADPVKDAVNSHEKASVCIPGGAAPSTNA